MLQRKNLFCGDVDARTAGGAVALIAQCDEDGYSEDHGADRPRRRSGRPTRVTWSSYALEGEAYEEPGISARRRQRCLAAARRLRHPHRGRASRRHTLDTSGQEYTVTATITDKEQVSFLYGDLTGRPLRAGRADADR